MTESVKKFLDINYNFKKCQILLKKNMSTSLQFTIAQSTCSFMELYTTTTTNKTKLFLL